MKQTNIVFSDHIGRIVSAKLISETIDKIVVSNPVIIHAEPQPQTGQIQVHTFPYVFMEFATPDSREGSAWTFARDSIAISTIELDERLQQSVDNINKPKEAAPSGKVVNLFDEE
jgi:hypothetical protein